MEHLREVHRVMGRDSFGNVTKVEFVGLQYVEHTDIRRGDYFYVIPTEDVLRVMPLSRERPSGYTLRRAR